MYYEDDMLDTLNYDILVFASLSTGYRAGATVKGVHFKAEQKDHSQNCCLTHTAPDISPL